ncbi:MAG: hypothetical protein WCI26_05730 [Acidimicrobiales bacterium]
MKTATTKGKAEQKVTKNVTKNETKNVTKNQEGSVDKSVQQPVKKTAKKVVKKTVKADAADQTTLVVLVVDRSGSMTSIKEDMEGGIKTLLEEQSQVAGTCLVTLAQFDSEYELVADATPIAELADYLLIPRGSTALLDAIGRTIGQVESRLKGLAPDDQPDHVLFAVITDGMENASSEWTRSKVMKSVKAKVAGGWDFMFLGANQDAIEEGAHMGFAAETALTFEPSSEGIKEAWSSVSMSMGKMRRGEASALEFTEEDRKAASGQ